MSKTLFPELIKFKIALVQEVLGRTIEGIKEKTLNMAKMFKEENINTQEITFKELKPLGCMEIRLWDCTLTCLFKENDPICKKCILFLDDDNQVNEYYQVYDQLFESSGQNEWINRSAHTRMKIEFDMCAVLSFTKLKTTHSGSTETTGATLYN